MLNWFDALRAEPNLFPGRAGNLYPCRDPIRLTIEGDEGKAFPITITGALLTGTTGTEYQATLNAVANLKAYTVSSIIIREPVRLVMEKGHVSQLKPVAWVGSTRRDLLALSVFHRDAIGYTLFLVQSGQMPHNAKPLAGFGGASVQEIRLDAEDGTYRCVYTVQFAEAVYVLHVFQKKSKTGIATPKPDMALIRDRLKQAKAYHDRFVGKGSH